MAAFPRIDGSLYAERVPLERIACAVGTPAYVYSSAHFDEQYRNLAEALTPLSADIFYSVKANSNVSVLRRFRKLGAGFDIVSGGELLRVIHAGGDPRRVLFSGVGKSEADVDYALKLGIGCFNVESAGELDRIAARATLLGSQAPISIRVNPDVDAHTHPYISTGLKENKFGVPVAQALALYRRANADPALVVRGVDCHIGSQLLDAAPLLQAFESLLSLVDQLGSEGIHIEHVDLGGGLGVPYDGEDPFDIGGYGARLATILGDRQLKLVLEPGRFLVANGGVLLTRVEYLKPSEAPGHKDFAIVDAAMNDLLRPALYQAHHAIDRVTPAAAEARRARWDIVGPVCESGDFLGHDRPLELVPGDLLAIGSAGAYGMVQSSNYNSRGRPPEVLVSGDEFRVIRRRETNAEQLRLERLDPCA